MPSTSAKQAKFMRAVAHSPKFAKKVGVPQSVGKDINMADKKIAGKKPATNISKTFDDPDAERIPTKKEADDLMGRAMPAPKRDRDTLGRAMPSMPGKAKGGKCYARGGGIEKKGKTKGTMVKMAKGGSIDGIAMKGKTRCKGAK
jgi:hypothetical protein